MAVAATASQFKEFGWFEVIGDGTGKRYRILYGAATNVHELDGDGQPQIGWCFVPKGYLVPGDVMLAQKIALETNERAALAVANRFPFVGDDQRSQTRLVGMREPRNCGDSAGLHPLITDDSRREIAKLRQARYWIFRSGCLKT